MKNYIPWLAAAILVVGVMSVHRLSRQSVMAAAEPAAGDRKNAVATTLPSARPAQQFASLSSDTARENVSRRQEGRRKNAYGIALSSYVSPAVVDKLGLTDREIAQLEMVMKTAKLRMFRELVGVAALSIAKDGRLVISIPAGAVDSRAHRDKVQQILDNAIGSNRASTLMKECGKDIQNQFAYFGEYAMELRLSSDGGSLTEGRYITIDTSYRREGLERKSSSVSTMRRSEFEETYFRVDPAILSMAKAGSGT